jgi:predicted Zn-dependent protease
MNGRFDTGARPIWVARRSVIGLAAALSTAAPRRAPAQPLPLRPSAVWLRLPAGAKEQALAFMRGLTRRIETALLPPLRIEPITLDLRGVAQEREQLLAEPLFGAVMAAIAQDADPAVPQIVLIGEDMRMPPARFNFAISRGGAPVGLVIISLSRLVSRDPDLTAARVARMAIKNVARVLGYPGSGACVFAFPRTLAELDAMPESYCEPDLAVLRAAGIAR